MGERESGGFQGVVLQRGIESPAVSREGEKPVSGGFRRGARNGSGDISERLQIGGDDAAE